MTGSLHKQAMERMQQLYPVHPSSASEDTKPKQNPPPLRTQNEHISTQKPLLSLMKQLGLDRDQIILLITLAVLYYDHASPKILLAILYIML